MRIMEIFLIVLAAILTISLHLTAKSCGASREIALDLRAENEQALCGYELTNYGLCTTPKTRFIGDITERVYIFVRNNHNVSREFSLEFNQIPESGLKLNFPEGQFNLEPKKELRLYGYVSADRFEGEAKFVVKVMADGEDYAIGQFYVYG